jgi:hypothetical protein
VMVFLPVGSLPGMGCALRLHGILLSAKRGRS